MSKRRIVSGTVSGGLFHQLWSATSAPDTPASLGTIVGKEAGIVNIPSNHSVDETVDRLENILQSKEITLFALIDHSGEAAKVGMKMPPTKLLIFGNPKGGTFHAGCS